MSRLQSRSNEAARLVSAVGRSTVRPHQVSGTGAALASSSTSGRFQDGHPGLPAGASTPYKRWSKCSMEKVRWKVFAAFFRKLGEAKVSLLIVALISCANYHLISSYILQVAIIKIFKLQSKLTHSPQVSAKPPPII